MSLTESVCRLRMELLFRHLLPFLVLTMRECWAGHVLSPPVIWAGLNMFVLLKIKRGSSILLSKWLLAFTSHQHDKCPLSSMSSPPFTFVDWGWPFRQVQCSVTEVLICTSLTIPDVQHIFMDLILTSVCGIDCGNFLLHSLPSFNLFSISYAWKFLKC